MARTEYGGARVRVSITSAPGLPTTQVSTPTRTACGPSGLSMSLGAGGAKFVDDVEHGLRRHPGAGVGDRDRSHPARWPPPCRSGSTVRPAGPGRLRWRPGRWCRRPAWRPGCAAVRRPRCSARLRAAAASPAAPAGRPDARCSSESPDSVWRTWVTIAMPEQQAQHHRQHPEHHLRAGTGGRGARRLVGGQFVRRARSVLVRVGHLRPRTTCGAMPPHCRRSGCRAPR